MKRFLALILALSMLLTACGGGTEIDPARLAGETAAILLERTPEPVPGSLGGDWLVLALCRLGAQLPEGWVEGYREKLVDQVADSGGVLHEKKYTEYSRVILAATAVGLDARDVVGYDLTAPLENFEQTIFQGINGAIYALLALDCGGYGSDAIREQLVDHLLSQELSGGGWCLMGGEPEADLTAMALQALTPYRDRADVDAAVQRGLAVLDKIEMTSSESVSQTIIALGELGVGAGDKRVQYLLDELLSYRTEDGMFRHVADGAADPLATEQAFCALVSAATGGLYHTDRNTCTLEIRCDTLLDKLDRLSAGKTAIVPEDGVIFAKTTVSFTPGESVFDVLRRCLKEEGIHFEYVDARAYDSVYIEGIANLYEFDCGDQSGWLFAVNGISPSLGCSGYTVSAGDEILFAYTCDMGLDLGLDRVE